MKKFTNEVKTALLKAAQDVNFYGKRKRDTKLECIEDLTQFKGFEASFLVDWLEDNKPVKPTAAGRTSSKLDANIMRGNETRTRDTLKVIGGDCFIVTSAQNNTQAASVFSQLQQLAEQLNAQLLVLPTYYNKKAFSASVEDDSEYFDEEIKPYLLDNDAWLHAENCVKLAAQASAPLTAKQPINMAVTLNNGELCTIVGHPKIQQKTLLKMAGEEIKTAWTTGSCTQFNYLRGRAGSEAENAHGFGATLVQIDPLGKPFCTNIVQAEDGSIMFLDYKHELYQLNVQTYNDPIVTVGDSHFEMFDPQCYDQVSQLLKNSGCKLAVLHDIAHSESRNHHNINKSSHWYKAKQTSIFDELKFIIECVNGYAEICDLYLVQSNHNAVIDGWLDSQTVASSIMFDTTNSKIFHLLKYLVCEAIDNNENHAGLILAFENADLTGLPELAKNVRWGSAHIPEVHYNVAFESHGHKGANGAAKGLTTGRIAQSMCLGHTHSPEISYMTSRGGIVTQGTTGKMDQGYNRGGGSSWAQASLITHSNGITQQFFHNL